MKIQPICSYNIASKGSKIPVSSKIVNQNKLNDIDAMKLAGYFEKFEEDLRLTMETFIYMIKH